MTILDLEALAAYRPRALELALKIRAGDLEACFDGEQLVADVKLLTREAHDYADNAMHRFELTTDPSLPDAVLALELGLAGIDVLDEALCDARDASID